MSLIKRVSVLLACLIVGGLASVPLAGAANATDPGAPSLPSVENTLQGSGSGADSDPTIQQREAELERAISRHNRGSNATTSGASISDPNFGKQKRRCRKIRNTKRKRACLKKVNKRQKRYQRRNRVRKMPFAVAKRETMDFAESAYLELDMDGYNAGNCKRLSRAKVRCIYVVWEDYFDDYGYYADRLICTNYMTSWYDRRNQVRVKFGDGGALCFWDSEV